jgi:hypothetical protein
MTGIFFSSKVWTPSLVLAEQALCHLSHTSRPSDGIWSPLFSPCEESLNAKGQCLIP